MQIRYAMSRPPASVPPEASLRDAARHMADAGVGALPVVEHDRVIGVVTDRDLVVRAMACGLAPETTVETVMSTDPVTVDVDTTVPVALHAMRSIRTRHLPVVDEGRLVGVVSFDDLLWQLTQQLGDLAAVANAARKVPDPFHTARPDPPSEG